MTGSPNWFSSLVPVIGMSPIWFVLLIGAGLCVQHWGDQRRRAILIGFAILLQFVSKAVSMATSNLVFDMAKNATGSHEIGIMIINLIWSMPQAVSLLLIYYAAFYAHPRPAE